MMGALETNLDSGFRSTRWYAELTSSERRTFWACFGGYALDALDVQIFSFAIPAIIAAFSITNVDAGLIATVTLLTSGLGGWFAGMLADRFGRVRILQITILWFAVHSPPKPNPIRARETSS
jgi:sugar phosphate permease